jgi:3-oxoadipate enol-lactonase
MAFLDLPTHRLHYRIDGRDGAPWLTFCNSLGTDLTMWDQQADALAGDFRILRYDRRGHGASGAPAGAYTVADLGGDVIALWDALGVARSHFCGLSIGGLVGQWLALDAPARLDRIAVCATAARIGTSESWQARIAQVRAHGLQAIADGTAERWFTPAWAAAHPEEVAAIIARFLATDAEGYTGCCSAVGGADFHARLDDIRVPLLAIAGADDPVCPPSDLQAIADGARDGRGAQVPGRHICNVESPREFNALLRAFLLHESA